VDGIVTLDWIGGIVTTSSSMIETIILVRQI